MFTDSKIEREFVKELDTSTEVVVYAKLPRGFLIPTPVGDYNPDWAIAFKDGTEVKHVYFVAETKGSMSSMELGRREDQDRMRPQVLRLSQRQSRERRREVRRGRQLRLAAPARGGVTPLTSAPPVAPAPQPGSVRITPVKIDRFRAIGSTEIELGDTVALVGQNGSGKSSILRALNAFFNFDDEKADFENGTHAYCRTMQSVIEVTIDGLAADAALPPMETGGSQFRARSSSSASSPCGTSSSAASGSQPRHVSTGPCESRSGTR